MEKLGKIGDIGVFSQRKFPCFRAYTRPMSSETLAGELA